MKALEKWKQVAKAKGDMADYWEMSARRAEEAVRVLRAENASLARSLHQAMLLMTQPASTATDFTNQVFRWVNQVASLLYREVK